MGIRPAAAPMGIRRGCARCAHGCFRTLMSYQSFGMACVHTRARFILVFCGIAGIDCP